MAIIIREEGQVAATCRMASQSLDKCIKTVVQSGGDANALYWLRMQSGMLGGVELGRRLLALCEECRVSPGERDDKFFLGLKEHLMPGGQYEIAPVNRELFVVAMGKASAWEHYEALAKKEGLAGRCLQPFAFQTANGKDFRRSLFFIFAHWQDALHAILRIVSEGQYLHRWWNVGVCVL